MRTQTFIVVVFLSFVLALFPSCSKKSNPTDATGPTNTGNPNVISVAISSIPSGAKIFINGSFSNDTTPHTFSNLASGNYQFAISKTPDYDSVNHSYYLVEGDQIVINDTLTPSWDLQFTNGTLQASYPAFQTNQGNGYVNNYLFPQTLIIPKYYNIKLTIIYSTENMINGNYNNGYSDNVTASGGQIWFGSLYPQGANSQGTSTFGFLQPTSSEYSYDTVTFEINKNLYPTGTQGKICFGVANGQGTGGWFYININKAILSTH